MKFSTKLWISAVFWTGLAAIAEDLAAAYVSLSAHVIFYWGHAVEMKLNKLLDQFHLSVPQYEIDE